MYQIAVCDQNEKSRHAMAGWLWCILRNSQVVGQVEEYGSQSDLMESLAAGNGFDLFCLGTELEVGNGYEVACRVQAWNRDARFIICGTPEAGSNEWDPQSFWKLKEPVVPRELEKKVREFLNILHVPRTVLIRNLGASEEIAVEEVCYVELINFGCCFHMESGKSVMSRMSMVQGERLLLDQRFVRCSVDHMVNLCFIRKIEGRYILLEDGTRLLIGYRYASRLSARQKEYFAY